MAGVESTLCLCDASDGACCDMLTVAHRTPSHPPPSCFWTPFIVRWLPHSICASCLPLTGLQYERAGMTLNMSCSPNQHTVLPVGEKKERKLVVLQHLHVDFYDRSTLFLAVEATDSFYSDSSHIKW